MKGIEIAEFAAWWVKRTRCRLEPEGKDSRLKILQLPEVF